MAPTTIASQTVGGSDASRVLNATASDPTAKTLIFDIRGPVASIDLENMVVVNDTDKGAAMVTSWENANTCGYFATASSSPFVCGSPSVCATNTANIVGCTMDGGLEFYKSCMNGEAYKAGKCDDITEFDMILCCGGDDSVKATDCGTFLWTASPTRTMFSCVETASVVYMLDEPLFIMQSTTAAGSGSGSGSGGGSYSFPTSSSSVSIESLTAITSKTSGGASDTNPLGPITTTHTLSDHVTTEAITKSVTVTSIIMSTGTVTGTASVYITIPTSAHITIFPTTSVPTSLGLGGVDRSTATSDTTSSSTSSSADDMGGGQGEIDGGPVHVSRAATIAMSTVAGFLVVFAAAWCFIRKRNKARAFFKKFNNKHDGGENNGGGDQLQLEEAQAQNDGEPNIINNNNGNDNNDTDVATTPRRNVNVNVRPIANADNVDQNGGGSVHTQQTSIYSNDNAEDQQVQGTTASTTTAAAHHVSSVAETSNHVVAELEGSPVVFDDDNNNMAEQEEAPARGTWDVQRGKLASLFKRD